MIVCADCGPSNPDDAPFCRSCNTFLGWEGTRVEREPVAGAGVAGGEAMDAGSGGGSGATSGAAGTATAGTVSAAAGAGGTATGAGGGDAGTSGGVTATTIGEGGGGTARASGTTTGTATTGTATASTTTAGTAATAGGAAGAGSAEGGPVAGGAGLAKDGAAVAEKGLGRSARSAAAAGVDRAIDFFRRADRHRSTRQDDATGQEDRAAGQEDRAVGQEDRAVGQERATDQQERTTGQDGKAATGQSTTTTALADSTTGRVTAADAAAPTGDARGQGSTGVEVRQPIVRQPTLITQRRPVRPVDEPRPEQPVGERVCPHCGRGNASARRFCSSCGRSLEIVAEEEQLPWWRRLLNRLTKRRQRARRSTGVARRIIKITAFLCVLAILAVVGPPLVSQGITALRDRMQASDPMRPTEVTGSSAYGPDTQPERVFDGANNRYWAPQGPAVDAWVEAAFAEPFRVTDILIHSGINVNQEQFLTVGRPHELALIVTKENGDTVEETLVLRDRPGEQRFKFKTSDVIRIRLIIRSTFGPESEPAAALAEVEFFGRM